uniref:IgGFc-binding protein-like n=1 Tax=Saccoglossus kowalevskii TaxID=10224 RepID=A0ABM0M7P4_SACKO|nr:PREDICTED: IgGFc-binding protein-like [Saccoglossus kowalevskii]
MRNDTTVSKRGTIMKGLNDVVVYTVFATCEYVTFWVMDLSGKFKGGWLDIKSYTDPKHIPNKWTVVYKNPVFSFLGSTTFTMAFGPYEPCTTTYIQSQLRKPKCSKAVGSFSLQTDCPCDPGCGQGDPHYERFDNHRIQYSGPCSYILAQTCKESSYKMKVVAKHGEVVKSSQNGARRIESAEITAQGNTIILNDKGIILNGVKVDGANITADASAGIQLINNSTHIIFSISGDWWIEWMKVRQNGNHRLIVGIHKNSTLIGNLCGLLGNKLPDNQTEDFKGFQMANGAYTHDVNELGDSWVVTGSCKK